MRGSNEREKNCGASYAVKRANRKMVGYVPLNLDKNGTGKCTKICRKIIWTTLKAQNGA